LSLPRLRIGFAIQNDEVAMQSVAQNLGAVDAEGIGPVLNQGRVFLRHTEAKHRHTAKNIAYDNLALL
jgi:hypothetical protein